MSSSHPLYKPLSKEEQEIRLLVLQPGSKSDPLEGYLDHFSLWNFTEDTIPFWTALSYSYLYATLRQLRDLEMAKTLWVDQLCINQSDNEERSWQVSIMRLIYERASVVIGWLGNYDESLKTLLRAVEIVGGIAKFNVEMADAEGLIETWSSSKVYHLCDIIRGNDIKLDSVKVTLQKLLNLFIEGSRNEWFNRKWIVQEHAVAKMLVLQAGHFSTVWFLFYDAFKGVTDCMGWPGTEASDAYRVFYALDITYYACLTEQEDLKSAEILRLSTLLNAHQVRKAGDPKDHIYALIGISRDGSKETQGLIDYSQTIESVYQKVATHCITTDRSLELLLNCCAGKQRELSYKLPSWTRDWTDVIA
ncbi:hypothetical protein G7Y89_g7497 [Cudoniella acicularis]|uniref:Heterokaryon incompatibility domain-containing protein n=1 Tax=Cudoniella acicularis TaxID=354080 RepID=A0A8H4W3R7_9HELO|nr:hypothetical protein G7Y89_g7497 [Cudoniella acicularis]